MDLDHRDPPSYQTSKEDTSEDILEPVILALKDQLLVSDNKAATKLYQMNWNIASVPQCGSSVIFERIEGDPLSEINDSTTNQRNEHIFYLAHPAGAKYQEGTPEYYLTSVSPKSLGNISLEISKSTFQKTEFRMLLSAGRNWSGQILFDEDLEPLFEVKPKWMGGRYIWTDRNSNQVAYEDKKGDQQKLVIQYL